MDASFSLFTKFTEIIAQAKISGLNVAQTVLYHLVWFVSQVNSWQQVDNQERANEELAKITRH